MLETRKVILKSVSHLHIFTYRGFAYSLNQRAHILLRQWVLGGIGHEQDGHSRDASGYQVAS